MGVRELRQTFNEVAAGLATCDQATLGYDRLDGTEFQILTFGGIWADGSPFSVVSERLPAGADTLAASRDTALKMLKERPAP